MNFPPKAISVLLLVQCLFIWMGYALTRRMFCFLEMTESPATLNPKAAIEEGRFARRSRCEGSL